MNLGSAVRRLVRLPSFSLAVVATVALGVGATAAMFSVVYAVLLQPLPYPAADRLAMVWERRVVDPAMRLDARTAAQLAEHGQPSTDTVAAWREGNRSFEDIAAYAPHEFAITGLGDPERVEGLVVSSAFFRVLGRSPAVGRGFTAEEDRPGPEVAILGHGFWSRHFGQDPGTAGRTIEVDGVAQTVVGILPADFHLVLPHAPRDPDLLTTVPHSFFEGRTWGIVLAIGRLAEGVGVAAARDELAAVARRLVEANPRSRTNGANVVPLADEMTGEPRLAVLVLFGATLVVLLVACVNVASLLLVRASARQKELAVRAALGAGRWRLVRLVAAESLALAAAGGLAGVVLAWWGTRTLVALVPQRLFPRLEDVRVNGTVLVFGLALAVAAGLAAAVAPAIHAFGREKPDTLARALNETQRTATVGRRTRLLRRALVASQVALAMVLLVGAALLTETYVRLTRVDLGLDPRQVLTFGVTLPPARYATPESTVAFETALLARLVVLPGVEAAGLTNSLPIGSGFTASGTVAVEGQKDSREFTRIRTVSPGLFAALGIRLAFGRLLEERDLGTDVAVVNRVVVRRFWPDAPRAGPEPLGRLLQVGQRWCRIVGVVEDVKYDGPDGAVEMEAYVPLTYWPVGYLSAAMRTAGDPASLAALARQAVRAADPGLPVQDLVTLEEVIARRVAPQRFRFALVGAFAVLALLLAMVGLYGVISQTVAQRTQEIGIRLALGAGRARIARMVLLEGLALAAAGIAAGVAAAAASTRVLAGFLFGVAPSDARTYAIVAAGLLAVAALASYAPSRRAARSDPAMVLREL